ncbi:stearoyl-CoA desaturase 5 isoform X1 [Patagioenas fasciata]|uniref:stearoyl-CoA desaturase 5 isoform X1 n=1 Tax=Patagioenas fasciata TaxID=372321 RepID=UPI003A994F2A
MQGCRPPPSPAAVRELYGGGGCNRCGGAARPLVAALRPRCAGAVAPSAPPVRWPGPGGRRAARRARRAAGRPSSGATWCSWGCCTWALSTPSVWCRGHSCSPSSGNDIYEWSRDHRVHHKYSETDADPHNARRGFFFSHIGWLFVRKHRDVIEKGRKLDFTDLLDDPVVRFQRKYYKSSVVLMCFVIPTVVPWYLWGESLWNAYFLASILRYTISLNVTWLVNSAAHMYGNRPYDKYINPRQNTFVTLGAIGEGFHNYHHTFPFDYSASELGLKFNPTTWFIDFMFWLGLVTDRKQAPKEMIQARKERTGDGSA